MVNCNPETVSTDYDTSDRLYFEPLTLKKCEHLRHGKAGRGDRAVWRADAAESGAAAEAAGVPTIAPIRRISTGRGPQAVRALLAELGVPSPEWGTATSVEEATETAARLGYPCCAAELRAGGRAMVIAYEEARCGATCRRRCCFRRRPVLIDRFLEDAIEIDVDALSDGEGVLIAASWSTSRKPGCTRATVLACCRRSRFRRGSWR